MERISIKAFSGSDIPHPLLKKITIMVLVLSVLLIIIIILSVWLYAQGLNSYNEVVFADGAVSDNMQML